ncbi:myb-like protein X [Palaemon carinicauda]|uniref:myb-like protein X n=1 Tax=Palaemon carinicauda TaxID=392227 RepID=UPI0035B59E3D
MGEFHPNQLSSFDHPGSISSVYSSDTSNTSCTNKQTIKGNIENGKEENEMKGNEKDGDESRHEGDSSAKHTAFYQSLSFLLHIASCLGINVIGIKNGTICICPYRAAVAVVALLVVSLSLVMSLGIIFSVDATYQQKVLILPLFSANCFCCYTQIFWLIKSRSIANFLIEVEAFKLKINRSYPIKVAVCYSFCYSIIYTVFVYIMVPLPDHIFMFRNCNLDYMLTFPVFVTCFIPSMFDLYIFTFTLFLVVALERLRKEIQTIKVWSKEETNTVAKNWLECRNLLGIFNGVFSYLLHVRVILFVMHAIAHLFALTSMKFTKDCAFYFWPLLFSLLENSIRYLGVCQTGQHLINTHFLVAKAVREAVIKQCFPDTDQNIEGDDTSSWLFIDYETGKHSSATGEFKPIKLEDTTAKMSEKTISMTKSTTRLKRATAAESTTPEKLNLHEMGIKKLDDNATEERPMEMEVNCFLSYEEKYIKENCFLEETSKENLVNEITNEETTEKDHATKSENASLILDDTNTQVVPSETGRPSLLSTKDFENNSRTEEAHVLGDNSELQSSAEEHNTLKNNQSDTMCYTVNQEVIKEINPRNKGDDHEMSGPTCETSFPSGSTYRANGSDLNLKNKSTVDQVAYSKYEVQELKDVPVCKALYPSKHDIDLKQTLFAGGTCKEEPDIENYDAPQKEAFLAHDCTCDNDECICKTAALFVDEGTCEVKRNSELDIEVPFDEKSTKLKEIIIFDKMTYELKKTDVVEGGTCGDDENVKIKESFYVDKNTELKKTVIVDKVTCGNTELKETIFVDEGNYEDIQNTEVKELIYVDEMTYEDDKNEPKEIIFVDGVTNKDNENVEPKEIISVDGVTYEYNENIELNASIFLREVVCEGNQNTDLHETGFADEDTYAGNENTELKETISVDKGNCEKILNVEVKEIIFVDEVTYKDNKNTEPKEIISVDGVIYDYDTNNDPKEIIIVDGVTYEDNENTLSKEIIVVDGVTYEDNENTGLKEIIPVDVVSYEDDKNSEPKKIISVEGVTYEADRNNEEKEIIFVDGMTYEDKKKSKLDTSVFVNEVTSEDYKNTELQLSGYDGTYEDNNMTETMEKVFEIELASKDNITIPTMGVTPERKNIEQNKAYPTEGVIWKDENKRQTESFAVNEVTFEDKDLRQTETLLADEVANKHNILMGEKGTCFACKETIKDNESTGRKESFFTDVLAFGDNKVSGRSEKLFVSEVTSKDENVSCPTDIIFAEDNTSKCIYSRQEESSLTGKASNESDQDLGLKIKSHQTPEKAQVSVRSNQHFTKNGSVIKGDVIYERSNTKLQGMFLDNIASNNRQLANQKSSLTSTLGCEEMSVHKGHNSSVKTIISYRQSLANKMEFIQNSENKETLNEASDTRPPWQSKEQKEICTTNTVEKEICECDRNNLENDIELDKKQNRDKEVYECTEELKSSGESTEIGPLGRLCLQRFMCHLEEFPFSADVWGAHPLSASSYVTCLGIVVTYLLMLLQLQPILSDDGGDQDLDNLLNDQGIFQCFSK